MSKLEDLRPNASVQGILPNCPVTVVNTQWLGCEAIPKAQQDRHRNVKNNDPALIEPLALA